MASPPLSADPIAGGAKRPRSALDDVAVESTDPRSLSGAAAEASGRETSGKRPATGSARSAQSNAENRRALRAVIDSLQVIDGEELEPPTGSMNVPLLPHQRASLAWMVKREARSSPRGGILADDQGLGKTVSALATIVTHRPPPGWKDGRGPLQRLESSSPATPLHSESASDLSPAASSLEAGGVQTVSVSAARTPDLDGTACGAVSVSSTAEEGSAPAAPAQARALSRGMENGSGKESDAIVDSNRGKISAAAMVARQGQEGGRRAGTLVVCPTTVLQQWLQEFKEKVAAGSGLSAYIYHGSSRVQDERVLARYDLVITTYSILALGLSSSERGGKSRGAGRDPLFGMQWFRVVLDEAQLIKNARTLVCQAACALQAEHRWCLSGTPIQNSIDELQSFFAFLRYEPYHSPSSFRALVRDPVLHDPAKGMLRVSAILRGVVLRRTKDTRVGGQPLVPLPPRVVRRVMCDMTDEERGLYDKILEDSRAQLSQHLDGGRSSYVNVLLLMLRLRQCCDHPWLANPPPHLKARKTSADTPASIKTARKLPAAVRERMTAALSKGPSQCASCLDIPEDPLCTRCCHIYCHQCAATSLGGSSASLDAAFDCHLCGASVRAADLLPLHALLTASGSASSAPSASPAAQGSAPTFTPSAKIRELLSILREMRQENGGSAEGLRGAGAGAGAPRARPQARVKSASRLAGAMRKLPPPPTSVAVVRDAERGLVSKAIVFSQWTSMLDLVEGPLRQEGFGFRRLDGTMSVAAREAALKDFRENPAVEVMLMSLKAAALGLNLVCANHVVLLDPWFNPTVEEQAIDRAHRIGQTRPVKVTRLTVKNSVEERIIILQERKMELAKAALGDAGADASGSGAAALSLADLRFLFGVEDLEAVT